MIFRKKAKKIDNYVAPEKTIFDGTNEEVLAGFGEIINDVKAIITDEDFPSVFIAPDKLSENATKKELGEVYIREKVGHKMYQLISVFIIKKPNNVYNIFDTLFCAKKGTYKTRAFKDTLRDLKLLSLDNLKDFLAFFQSASLLK